MDMIISVYEILKMHQRLGKQLYIWDNWSIKSRKEIQSEVITAFVFVETTFNFIVLEK